MGGKSRERLREHENSTESCVLGRTVREKKGKKRERERDCLFGKKREWDWWKGRMSRGAF